MLGTCGNLPLSKKHLRRATEAFLAPALAVEKRAYTQGVLGSGVLLLLQQSEFPQCLSAWHQQAGSLPSGKLTFVSPGSDEQLCCRTAFVPKENIKGSRKLAEHK